MIHLILLILHFFICKIKEFSPVIFKILLISIVLQSEVGVRAWALVSDCLGSTSSDYTNCYLEKIISLLEFLYPLLRNK